MRTIVWDVDDVLNDLMRRWLEDEWLPRHPECRIRYEDLSVNPPCEILGCSMDDYLSSLDHFRLSKATSLKPDTEVLQWFHEHGHKFRHVALSATPLHAAPYSSTWVIYYFGKWIRSFNFVPSKRMDSPVPTYDESKAGYLRWWGRADILVDDNPEHINAAVQLEMMSFMVPRPWNNATGTLADLLNMLSRS